MGGLKYNTVPELAFVEPRELVTCPFEEERKRSVLIWTVEDARKLDGRCD